MALAFGHGSSIIAEWEGTYGTLASGTDWKRLPVRSYNPGIARPWERQDIVGLVGARSEPDPAQGLLTIEPTVSIQPDLNNIGYWLRLLFGDPTTTGSSDYSHTFKAGGTTPLSLSIEHGNAFTTNGYQRVLGVRANTLEASFRPGEAQQTFNLGLIAKNAPARASSSADASPADASWVPLLGPVMTATRAGTALPRVTGATLRFSNGLEVLREANRDGGAITEAAPGVMEVTGTVDLRMDTDTLLGDAEGTAPVALTFGYSISATQALTFTVPEAYLDRIGVGAQGRAGISATFAFRGAYNASAATSLSVVLLNQMADFE